MKCRVYYGIDKYYEYDQFKALSHKEDCYVVFFFNDVVMNFPKEIFNKVVIFDESVC